MRAHALRSNAILIHIRLIYFARLIITFDFITSIAVVRFVFRLYLEGLDLLEQVENVLFP